MTITTSAQLTLKAEVTPADPWASGKYTIGPNGETITIPSECDMVVSGNLTTASGSARNYEPDVHTYDSTALRDPNGSTVSIDTVYAVVLYNTHATASASFATTSFTSVAWSGVLQPGGYAVLILPAGLAVTSSSVIALSGISGTPSIRLTLFGAAA